jgi:soluble lytic murein transglycosylase-like protein
MKRKYILVITALSMGLYFGFPTVTANSVIAEAATLPAPAPEPTVLAEEPVAEKAVHYKEGLAAYITTVNDTVPREKALSIADTMLEQAEKHHIDETLLLAIAHTESTYYSDAVSCMGYKGLMQTGDVLAEEAGYSPDDLFDPEVSIAVGADYISDQLACFDQDMELALTAYNQGPGAVYAGDYSTGYAEVTLERMAGIEDFLLEEGYLPEDCIQ